MISRTPQLPGLPRVTALNQAGQPLGATERTPARILLVDAALALHESHVLFLQSIPATVDTLSSCADMYLHPGNDYALVILLLHSKSKEIAEAAFFVRHRWGSAKILLLEGEPAMIDDWLYDERIDPRLHPATMCEAAIRLTTKAK